MIASEQNSSNRPYWFVKANKSRLERFIKEGIWELFLNETKESTKYSEHLNSMKIGDRIAIKHYGETKIKELNFPISQGSVSTIFIAAIGEILDTQSSDQRVKVEWRKIFDHKEMKWHFFHPRDIINFYYYSTNDWRHRAFIDFTFYNVEQDINRFLRDERYVHYAVNQEMRASTANENNGVASLVGGSLQLNTVPLWPARHG